MLVIDTSYIIKTLNTSYLAKHSFLIKHKATFSPMETTYVYSSTQHRGYKFEFSNQIVQIQISDFAVELYLWLPDHL